jgi:6-phosphogluconolactonase (cycloisomerase 2 family)
MEPDTVPASAIPFAGNSFDDYWEKSKRQIQGWRRFMNRIVRALMIPMIVLGTMWLAGCGTYKCTATFGASTCTAGSGGISGGGGGGTSTAAAFVFAVDTTGGSTSGTIDGYTLDTTANTLSSTTNYTAQAVPLSDPGAGMVVAQGKFLYAAFQSTGQIFGWSISTSGGLTAVANSPYSAPFLVGFNPNAVAQQNMITNPAGTFLFLSSPSTAQIFVYSVGSGGSLTAVSNSPFAVPFSPLNLAIDGKGKYLYAIDDFVGNHTGSGVAAFSISSTGSLSLVGTYSFPMWQLAGEPSGKYLIGTTGNSVPTSGIDDNHLYVFSINQTTGALSQTGKFSTQFSPLTIAVQPNSSGNLVYSFGTNDTSTGYNPIEGYGISSTGTLSAVSGSPFSNIQLGLWGQFDQSGAFLLDYSSILDVSTNTLVTQLGVLDIGSGGAVTTPVAPATLVTPGYWVVTDVP